MNRIVQLIAAAPNWWLHYSHPAVGEFEGPVAAWALVETEDGIRFIEPVDPTGSGWDGDTVSSVSNNYEVVYRPDGPPNSSLWQPLPGEVESATEMSGTQVQRDGV